MPETTPQPGVSIRPLTFLHTYQIADQLTSPRAAQTTDIATGQAMPRWLRASAITRALGMPLYYYWATSGFDAFDGERSIGWIFLRGWFQLFYVDALLVHPEWAGRDVEAQLLGFAEQQARELKREWIGLTLNTTGGETPEWFEERGYQRTHWRVMHHTDFSLALRTSGQGVELRRLFGRKQRDAFRRFARQELDVGNEPAREPLTRFLMPRPTRWPGKSWHVVFDAHAIGTLNLRKQAGRVVMHIAAPEEWWGSAPLLAGVQLALQSEREVLSGERRTLDLRFASSGHHEAARDALSALGFDERPAATVRLFKRLNGGLT